MTWLCPAKTCRTHSSGWSQLYPGGTTCTKVMTHQGLPGHLTYATHPLILRVRLHLQEWSFPKATCMLPTVAGREATGGSMLMGMQAENQLPPPEACSAWAAAAGTCLRRVTTLSLPTRSAAPGACAWRACFYFFLATEQSCIILCQALPTNGHNSQD